MPLSYFISNIHLKTVHDFIANRLAGRIQSSSLRTLKTETGKLDFCSNDYLSFARSAELKQRIESQLKRYPNYKTGSTGSRLLAGNEQFTEDLEAQIARFYQQEAALLFNSGYDANVGLLSSLLQRGDTLITDELIHASMIDGARLSHAERFIFKHNDLESLEKKLKQAKGKIFVAIESIYSMNGDEAPLTEICLLCELFGAALIVDEAHATGIFGKNGRGLVDEAGLTQRVFACVITFGKALGASGAAVTGSAALKSYLINFARPFIYSTAASFYSHLCIQQAYLYLAEKDHQSEIAERIASFRELMQDDGRLLQSRSPIQCFIVPGNNEVKDAAEFLQNSNFDVRPIVSPTVPLGTERLRICLHNHNSLEEIKSLAQHLKKI